MKKPFLVVAALSLGAAVACTNQTSSSVKDGDDDPVRQALINKAYSCSLIDDFDSWSIEVELGPSGNVARFFDNDHWSDLNDHSYDSLETAPPQDQHTFKGVDSVFTDLNLTFVFNETRLKGTLNEKSSNDDNSYDFSCQAEQARPSTDCAVALSDNFQRDAHSFHFHTDEFDHDIDSGSAAMAVAKLAAGKTGCDATAITYSVSEQASSACQEILPGMPFSKACYVATNVGYFIVSETMPDGIAVTWSRWD